MESYNKEEDKENVITAIEQLTDLDILSEHDMSVLALVILGVKPACGIAFGEDGGKNNPEKYRGARKNIEDMLVSLDLPFFPYVENHGAEGEGVCYYIGKDQEALDTALTGLHSDGAETTIQERTAFGRAMGYPETATTAWEASDYGRNPTLIDRKNPPPELAATEAYRCGFFSFSRDHWQEELPLAKSWANVLKEKAPRIYQKLLTREEPVD